MIKWLFLFLILLSSSAVAQNHHFSNEERYQNSPYRTNCLNNTCGSHSTITGECLAINAHRMGQD
jgi:hypothetical protein